MKNWVVQRRSFVSNIVLMAVFLMVFLVSTDHITSVSEASGGVTYGGRAVVVSVDLPLLAPIVLSDTGSLPTSGGAKEASLPEANVLGVLTAQVLHATTVGQGKASRSEASVADLNLTVAGSSISAGLLMTRAEAQCQGNDASVSGYSEVVSLRVNGVDIPVSGSPNQTIPLLVGSLTINEKQQFVDGDYGDITVNALRVHVDALFDDTDIVVSSAQAEITCAGTPAPGGDFVTGGGWITGTPSGAKANFGVAGGIKKNGALWGHLTYIDHDSGMLVKGTGIVDYVVVDATTRRIEGNARVDGMNGFTYVAIVSDQGEPGTADTFDVNVFNSDEINVYSASSTLGGGNIQLHN